MHARHLRLGEIVGAHDAKIDAGETRHERHELSIAVHGGSCVRGQAARVRDVGVRSGFEQNANGSDDVVPLGCGATTTPVDEIVKRRFSTDVGDVDVCLQPDESTRDILRTTVVVVVAVVVRQTSREVV